MTDFNYREYSLEQLSNWMHDAMSAGEATPQEIYDTILGVVKENYYTYKDQVSKAYELLVFLNGNGQSLEDVIRERQQSEPSMPPWEYPSANQDDRVFIKSTPLPPYETFNGCDETNDKVIKWVLPVEVDGLTGDCYVTLPDDLLERAGLVEGNVVEWVDKGNGSFFLKKVND